MAYVDVNNLRQEHIVRDNNDDLWIRKARQKTNNMCNIPLLKIPQLLMENTRIIHCVRKLAHSCPCRVTRR